MDTHLSLILIITFLFLLSQFIIQKVRNYLYLPMGICFFLIGFLLSQPFTDYFNELTGLRLPNLIINTNKNSLELLIFLILGMIGFTVGFKFKLKEFVSVSSEQINLSLIDILLSILLLGGFSFIAFLFYINHLLQLQQIILISLIVGIVFFTLSTKPLELIKEKFTVEGKNFSTLSFVPVLNNFISVLLIGVVFSFLNQNTNNTLNLNYFERFIIGGLIGLIFGFMFHFFIGREENENKLLVIITGLILIGTGVALYLTISPLLINLFLGFIAGNLFKFREKVFDLVKKFENIIYIILLIYAGALIKIENPIVFLTGIFIVFILKYFVKLFIGWLAYKLSDDKLSYSHSVGRGLNTQGIVAIGLLVNFYQISDHPLTDIVFSVMTVTILITDFISPKILKDLLIDLNEIK